MSIRLVTDKENVDYQAVADILDHFGLSHFDAATEEKILQCGTSGRRLSFW